MKLLSHRAISSRISSIFEPARPPSEIELRDLHKLVSQSQAGPNVTLNVGSIHPFEIQLVALISLTLQIGVVLFDVFSIYDNNLSQALGIYDTPSDGLLLTVAGTLAVSVGVFICCCVIEARIRLARWVPRDRRQVLRIVWLQKSQSINGHMFKACAIFASTSRHEISISQFYYKRSLGQLCCIGNTLYCTW